MGLYGKVKPEEEDQYAWPTEVVVKKKTLERRTKDKVIGYGFEPNVFSDKANTRVLTVPKVKKKTTLSKNMRQKMRFDTYSSGSDSDDHGVVIKLHDKSDEDKEESDKEFDDKNWNITPWSSKPTFPSKKHNTLVNTGRKKHKIPWSASFTTDYSPSTKFGSVEVKEIDSVVFKKPGLQNTLPAVSFGSWGLEINTKENDDNESDDLNIKEGKVDDSNDVVFEDEMKWFLIGRLENMLFFNKSVNFIPESTKIEDVCCVCADIQDVWAVGNCMHPVCCNCSLRMRSLYKTYNCVVCDQYLDVVRFTSDKIILSKAYKFLSKMNFEDGPKNEFDMDFSNNETGLSSQLDVSKCKYSDEKLQIYFDKRVDYHKAIRYLRFNCPNCLETVKGGWKELNAHAVEKHSLFLCPICVTKAKVFPHEHFLYTAKQLKEHLGGPKGSDIDFKFTSHPYCQFCEKQLFDGKHLLEHCKAVHLECNICLQAGTFDKFFSNEEHLERHNRREHIVCPWEECRKKYKSVFAREVEVMEHQIAVHGEVKHAQSKRKPKVLSQKIERGTFQSKIKQRERRMTLPPFIQQAMEANKQRMADQMLLQTSISKKEVTVRCRQ